MKIIITDEGNRITPEQRAHFEAAASACFEKEILPAFEIPEEETGAFSDQIILDMTVVEGEEIRRINAEFRNKDSVTDVLSFPQYPDLDAVLDALEYLEEDQELYLGDVVLCFEQALLQSETYGTTKERELTYLFVHSMLHLLGYDHMEDAEKKVMRAHEEAIMEALSLAR